MKEPLELWGPQLYLVVSRALDLKLRDVILVRPTINCMIWNKLCNLAGSPFPRIKWDFNFIVTFFDSLSHFGYLFQITWGYSCFLLLNLNAGFQKFVLKHSTCVWFTRSVHFVYWLGIYFSFLVKPFLFLETIGWYVELLRKPGLRSKKNIWVFILKRI